MGFVFSYPCVQLWLMCYYKTSNHLRVQGFLKIEKCLGHFWHVRFSELLANPTLISRWGLQTALQLYGDSRNIVIHYFWPIDMKSVHAPSPGHCCDLPISNENIKSKAWLTRARNNNFSALLGSISLYDNENRRMYADVENNYSVCLTGPRFGFEYLLF